MGLALDHHRPRTLDLHLYLALLPAPKRSARVVGLTKDPAHESDENERLLDIYRFIVILHEPDRQVDNV
ncbi:unnamed protein product [Peniophora sp. CBMAI 1063]|nr:unnamed protein product [Peniophora sp. CBMAI 1063]